jgi:YVTN family beta-propeller protein
MERLKLLTIGEQIMKTRTWFWIGALWVGCAATCLGDSTLAVVGRTEGVVNLYRAKGITLQLIKSIPIGKDPAEMCLDPTEKRLYVGETSKKNIAVVDVATQSVVATFNDPDMKKPDGCVVSPDSSKLYMIDSQGSSVSVFATDSGKLLGKIPVGMQPRRAIFTRDGKTMLVSNARSDTLSVIDVASSKPVRTVKTGKEPRDMLWTPDGKFLAVALIVDDSIAYFNADTLELDQQVGTGRSPQRLAVSSDGELMYSLSRYENAISVADLTKSGERRFLTSIPVGRWAFNMTMSADGRYLYTANSTMDNTISVVDLRVGKVMNIFPAGGAPGCMLFLK